MELHALKKRGVFAFRITCLMVLLTASLPGESRPQPSTRETAGTAPEKTTAREAAGPLTFWKEGTASELAEKLLGSMSDDEIVAQVFLLGYSGSTPGREVMDWIRTRNIGGVKIFGWNAENLPVLASSISSMQKAAAGTRWSIPLLIATDQEGGWVRHVKGATTETPGNLALGASRLPYDSFYSGYYIGRELHALGINMNFAPTTDVYTNPNASVIGPRSFSEDPVLVGNLSVAYFKGLRKAGIISTAKHFPGHGNADEDSHGTLPVIKDDFDTLWNRELLPYRFLINEGIPAIMSGHLSFPKITGDAVPASLSGFFQTETLRKKMGFNGIVVTDDLYMIGVRLAGLSTGDICIRALEAGNDMVMLSITPTLYDEIWTKVSERYRTNGKFRDLVRASVKRILTVKLEYLKSAEAVPLYPEPAGLSRKIPDPDGKSFFFEQACRSVTVIGDTRIPSPPAAAGRTLVVSPLADFSAEADRQYPGSSRFSIPLYAYARDEGAQLAATAKAYDTVVFCLVNEYSVKYLKHLELLADRVIVFSVLTPIFLRETPWVTSALAVFGWSTDTYKAGFAVLKGEIPPLGKLPVTLYPGGK